MSIDPLAEEYAYNSTYAFQENKMGMGRELEGLELAPHDFTTGFGNYAKGKYDSVVSQVQQVTSKVVSTVSTGLNKGQEFIKDHKEQLLSGAKMIQKRAII